MSDEEWEPGVPLFHRGTFQAQPMIALKHDMAFDGFGTDAARWSPEFGWRNV